MVMSDPYTELRSSVYRTSMKLTICQEIRHVVGGYIVEMRYPYGGTPGAYGEVLCRNLEEVFALIAKADIDPVHAPAEQHTPALGDSLQQDRSCQMCEHANEVPGSCPCRPDCYCKTNTCASRTA